MPGYQSTAFPELGSETTLPPGRHPPRHREQCCRRHETWRLDILGRRQSPDAGRTGRRKEGETRGPGGPSYELGTGRRTVRGAGERGARRDGRGGG